MPLCQSYPNWSRYQAHTYIMYVYTHYTYGYTHKGIHMHIRIIYQTVIHLHNYSVEIYPMIICIMQIVLALISCILKYIFLIYVGSHINCTPTLSLWGCTARVCVCPCVSWCNCLHIYTLKCLIFHALLQVCTYITSSWTNITTHTHTYYK